MPKGFGGMGGFGGLGDIAKMMKKAQQMQADAAQLQEELKNARHEVTVGGGVVKAVVDGKGKLVSLAIKPEAVDPDDVDMLQDLIVSAIKEAEERAEAIEIEKTTALTSGLDLPPGLLG